MNGSNWFDDVLSTEEGVRLYRQEKLILGATEAICQLMEDHRVSRKQLADRLGVSKGHISQLLDGSRNMTLRTLADVFTALGSEVSIAHERAGTPVENFEESESVPWIECLHHDDWRLNASMQPSESFRPIQPTPYSMAG